MNTKATHKTSVHSVLVAIVVAANTAVFATDPPGIIIDHSPASARLYIGSPALAILTNGVYVASHDQFGPASTEHQSAVTLLFTSEDKGNSWKPLSRVKGQFWSSLFVHHGALYLLGTDKHHGNIVLRCSTDGGLTWTSPTNSRTGLLRSDGNYHCAPMPVIEYRGRLWRAFEHRSPPVGWGSNYCAGMLSVAPGADLLDSSSWTFSNFLHGNAAWLDGTFGGWLEGNAVVTPAGTVADMLRVETPGFPEKAALVSISDDGKKSSFDPAQDFVDLPGGAKKFTVRYDPGTRLYFTLANAVSPGKADLTRPSKVRNTLALETSPDLRHWTLQRNLLQHSDSARHGFQYVDWLFDKDDIIAVCRTSFDDAEGGAHNQHDANYLTFHRFVGVRVLPKP